MRARLLSVVLALTVLMPLAVRADRIDSELGPIEVTTIASGLRSPWAVAFLPDGRYLVTERGGAMRIVDADGRIGAPLAGVPEVYVNGQGGLLDVALDPDFADNRKLYFSYAEAAAEGAHTAIASARLEPGTLAHVRVLFRQTPGYDGGAHFGSRIVIGRDGFLYATVGERGDHRDRAQELDQTYGKVIRIGRDGRIPEDNPFVGRADAHPAVWSYGHRNPQGLALNPFTGELFEHEHGPQGGDEINVIRKSANYGWPVITHGREYHGPKIGEGTAKAGMEQPLHYWDPSIAPSGMAFLATDAAGPWKGDLFVGALKFTLVARLELRGGKVVHEERLLADQGDRVRDVREGPDGALYVLTESRGRLLRLQPPGGIPPESN
ncbi:MAG TPA: PQQ-dependent sugar dehydrogenase [Pseudomonadota bacterium]|jgi:glucose/arabinose dehydrogenase|nr:PQQ-dependent sugar dehydrogenase [Pseudomonadota bacterium]